MKLTTSILIAVIMVSVVMAFGTKFLQAEQKDTTDTSMITSKLNEVVNNQQAIMQKLDEIKSELGVLKMRVTR